MKIDVRARSLASRKYPFGIRAKIWIIRNFLASPVIYLSGGLDSHHWKMGIEQISLSFHFRVAKLEITPDFE